MVPIRAERRRVLNRNAIVAFSHIGFHLLNNSRPFRTSDWGKSYSKSQSTASYPKKVANLPQSTAMPIF
ncbi:hypothetical protein CH375_11450 [Leptospira ellisii]|nr:hypothetical protein CH375_11450 [Leptospira ellisii]